MLDTEIGEADAATTAQQTPIPVEVNASAASARIAPIAMDDERVEESSRVELAGLVRDVGLNGKKASAWVVLLMEKDG